MAALTAALKPADVDYLYYLADKDGKTHFTASYDEFLKLKKNAGPVETAPSACRRQRLTLV